MSQSRNGFWLLMIPWNWNCVSTPVPRIAATSSAAISAAPLPSPTINDGSTNVASCADDDGPEPPAGFDPVDGSPYKPIARSSMLTAIQNGLMSPLTAVRLPLWSHVQPHIP